MHNWWIEIQRNSKTQAKCLSFFTEIIESAILDNNVLDKQCMCFNTYRYTVISEMSSFHQDLISYTYIIWSCDHCLINGSLVIIISYVWKKIRDIIIVKHIPFYFYGTIYCKTFADCKNLILRLSSFNLYWRNKDFFI